MPTKCTVGLLYPGHSAEDDYPLLERRLGDVSLRVEHTSVGEDAHRVDALLDLGGPQRLADGADALMGHGGNHGANHGGNHGARLDAVVWACTSGSFVFGWDGAHAQAAAVGERLGVPASSTSLAFVQAARTLGARTVALAATYPDEVTAAFVEFLAEAGIDVVHRASRGIVTAAEVGTLGRDDVLELATANDHPAAQAVLLPDTALHTVGLLEELEAALGKPVLTANQVTAWEGLRIAGWSRPREALGSLFRHQVEVRT